MSSDDEDKELVEHLQEVVRDPERWILDPELKGARVLAKGLFKIKGAIHKRPGKLIYKFGVGEKHYAYHFFTQVPHDRERKFLEAHYKRISEHLEKINNQFVASDRPSPWGRIDYFPQAYKRPESRNVYPILRTEWRDGKLLKNYLLEIKKEWDRGGDSVETQCIEQIDSLLERFKRLIEILHNTKTAHGNLSAAHIVVENEDIFLLDQSSLYPNDDALRESLGALMLDLEIEHERLPHCKLLKRHQSYQHPKHESRAFNERMDDFSAFVILLELSAFKFHLTTGKLQLTDEVDSIFIQKSDLTSPDQSSVFKGMRDLGDANLNKLLDLVREGCQSHVTHIPEFTPKIEIIFDPFQTLRNLMNASPRDWEAIGNEDERLQAKGVVLPEDSPLRNDVHEARRRYCLITHLREAIESQPPSARQIINAWKEADQESYRWETEIERARQQVAKLDELEAKNDSGHREVVILYVSCKDILSGCEEDNSWRENVELWAKQITACDNLLSIIKMPLPWDSDVEVAEAWKQFNAVGGHTDFEPERSRTEDQINACCARGEALEKMRAAIESTKALESTKDGETKIVLRNDGKLGPAPLTDEYNDRTITENWNELLLSQCPDVKEEERDLYAAAKARINIIDDVIKQITEIKEKGQGSESGIAAAAERLPPSYQYDQADRVEIARHRAETHLNLGAEFTAPISDIGLAQAFEDFKRAWDGTPHQPQFDSHRQDRIDRSLTRKAPLSFLKAYLGDRPTDEELAESDDKVLVEHWNEEIFLEPDAPEGLCPEAAVMNSRIENAMSRTRAATDIRDAIETIDQLRNTEISGAMQSEKGESFIVQTVNASGLSKSYLQSLLSETYLRIQQAQNRSALSEAFLRTIQANDSLDADIAQAWQALLDAGGDPAVAHHQTRAELACLRRDGHEKLLNLLRASRELDDEDHQLLEIWEDHKLENCVDAVRHHSRKQLAALRIDQWQKLEQCLVENKYMMVERLFVLPLSVFYPPVRDHLADIRSAISRYKQANEFLKVLENGGTKEQFNETFASTFLRDCPEFFEPHIDAIKRRKEDLFACYKFTPNDFYPPERISGDKIRVHWLWRNATHHAHDVISRAAILISKQPTTSTSTQFIKSTNNIYETTTENKYQDLNSSWAVGIPDGWADCNSNLHIAIWPIIEIECGDQSFMLQPDQPQISQAIIWEPLDETIVEHDTPENNQTVFEKVISRLISMSEK